MSCNEIGPGDASQAPPPDHTSPGPEPDHAAHPDWDRLWTASGIEDNPKGRSSRVAGRLSCWPALLAVVQSVPALNGALFRPILQMSA